jgi:hypothetical protein
METSVEGAEQAKTRVDGTEYNTIRVRTFEDTGHVIEHSSGMTMNSDIFCDLTKVVEDVRNPSSD